MEKELIESKQEEEKDPWYKGPIIYILAIFLLFLIILMAVPSHIIPLDPSPKSIPSISEVLPPNIVIDNSTENDYYSLLKPNDPTIKQIADKIVTLSCDGNKVCQAKAIYYFVRDNLEYISDPVGKEYIKSARETLITGGGDCDDHSVLTANLLESIGIKTKFAFAPNHVYIQAYLPESSRRYKNSEGYVNLDTTCKKCEFGKTTSIAP